MRMVSGYPGLATLAMLLLAAPGAARAAVCTAADLTGPAGCASNPTATCTIAGTFDVGDGCELDFQDHPVVLTGTLRSELSGGAFTIDAASLALNGGSLRVAGSADGDSGGSVTVQVAGLFRMQGSGALVDADGDDEAGGSIEIDAGSIDIAAGTLHANGTGGGSLDSGNAGGSITLLSAGSLAIGGAVRANASAGPAGGSAGGVIAVSGGGAVTVAATLEATGSAPDGAGGTITVESTGGGVDVTAVVTAEGKGGDSAGGLVQVAGASEIDVGANVIASGGANGFPGEIDLDVSGAPGTITVAAGKGLRAQNGGTV